MVDQMDDQGKALLQEANDLYDSHGSRRIADAELEDVFVNGNFTGRLQEVLGLDVETYNGKQLLVNLVRASVIDRTRQLSMLADPKYSVPNTRDPDTALTEQDVLINVHETMWEYWNIIRTNKISAFNIALKNRALWMLHPDFKNSKPMLYALDPAVFYAEPDYAGEYPRVFLIHEQTGRKLLAQYPEAKERFSIKDNDGLYRVIWFLDKKERRIWINNEEDKTKHIVHDLGFVPTRYTQDVHIPGSIDNMSNAYHSIGMAENFTDVMMLVSAEMRKRLHAVPYASGGVDPANAAAALEGDQVLRLEKGEKMGFAQPMDGQMGAHQHLQAMDEIFRVAANWPRLRSGQIDSAIWTGAGIGAAQSSLSADTLDVRESMANDLEWIDIHAIKMFKKMWGNIEHPIGFWDKSESVDTLSIKPNEDIPNHFRHKLIVSALGGDQVSKLVTLMQFFGQKIFDLRTVLENIPGANAPEIMRRLEDDLQRDLKFQMLIQKGMADIQANAQAQEAAIQNQAIEKGAMPQQGQGLIQGMVPTPDPRSAGYTG